MLVVKTQKRLVGVSVFEQPAPDNAQLCDYNVLHFLRNASTNQCFN